MWNLIVPHGTILFNPKNRLNMKQDRKYFYRCGSGKLEKLPNVKAFNIVLGRLMCEGLPYHVVIDFKPDIPHYIIVLDA